MRLDWPLGILARCGFAAIGSASARAFSSRSSPYWRWAPRRPPAQSASGQTALGEPRRFAPRSWPGSSSSPRQRPPAASPT